MSQDALPLLACVVVCFLPIPLLAVPAGLALLVYLPGLYALRCCRLTATPAGRHWLAIPMSLVVMGLTLGWAWKWSNDRYVLLAVIAAVNGTLLIAARRFGRDQGPAPAIFDSPVQRCLFAGLILWVGLCVFFCNFLPTPLGVHHPVGDYVKHHAVCLSLDRAGLPLQNVFFVTHADAPCYYYEGFYLFSATLRILTDRAIPIAATFGAMAGIVASTFVAMVFLIARRLHGSARCALFAAVCASIVGGWDSIPCFLDWIAHGHKVMVLDVWCPIPWRIHNLHNNFFWCPQHNAAALIFLLCCHLLQIEKGRRWWVILAPLAATAIFGTSVHHAITAFVAAAVFVTLELRHRAVRAGTPDTRYIKGIAAIWLTGLVLMIPRALQYAEMNARYEGGLTVRWDRFPLAFLGRVVPPGPLANLLDAPWLLVLDFGLGAITVVLISRCAWQRLWRDDGTRLLLIAGAIGLLTMWTIRSDVNRYDYGFRLASTFTMVCTALGAGFLLEPDMLRGWARRIRLPVLAIGILPGLPVGLYEAPVMAIRATFQPRAERADRSAFRFLRENTPHDAVVQRLPSATSELVQMTDRLAGVCNPSDSHVNIFRPPPPNPLREAHEEMESAFRTASGRSAYETMRKWGVTHLLVGSAERLKQDAWPQFENNAWFVEVYDDGHARVYRLAEPILSVSPPPPEAPASHGP